MPNSGKSKLATVIHSNQVWRETKVWLKSDLVLPLPLQHGTAAASALRLEGSDVPTAPIGTCGT